jgi:hypothetical protein
MKVCTMTMTSSSPYLYPVSMGTCINESVARGPHATKVGLLKTPISVMTRSTTASHTIMMMLRSLRSLNARRRRYATPQSPTHAPRTSFDVRFRTAARALR